jgi:hypothetical protein
VSRFGKGDSIVWFPADFRHALLGCCIAAVAATERVNPDQTSPHVVDFFEDDVVSRLDTTRSQVVIPHVEISDSETEKDAMERVAIELGGTVIGDTGGEEAESTYMGQVRLPTKVCFVRGAPYCCIRQ